MSSNPATILFIPSTFFRFLTSFPNPGWFHPPWPHMGLWSATRPNSFLAVSLFTPHPPLLTLDLLNEFTLVPLKEAEIRYQGTSWQREGRACTVTYRGSYLNDLRSGLSGGGELGADTFLLTITSHTGTHIPTS